MSDKNSIKELIGHGFTENGAKIALVSIKRGMNDAKHGRTSKVKKERI